ncbi:DNA/RNA nuclease SfsA [Aliagarivorans marinus]|uniref:DNA/RNA nuclease SfsA n=1 Tax=Aliagarivorans marinus TaxID=561965 RepID=UPI0004073A7C|nr:DNA/RNA nuclease SfsA [Aliagarivorans marinus]
MQLELHTATLLKRYKRFLADVVDSQGQEFTLHCPNTGAMTGCAEAGNTVYYSLSDNPKRKYPGTWELSQGEHMICVNTVRANQLVGEALEQGVISELSGYQQIRAEVRYGEENSRIDFLLSEGEQADCYIEVKSCTLLDESFGEGAGFFPDAVSTRGQKHLRELMQMKHQGYRAVLLFAVMHSGIRQVSPAAHIDAKYAELLAQAVDAGVEVYAYAASFALPELSIEQRLPVKLDSADS